MTKESDIVTEDIFLRYEDVRASGKWNMIMDMQNAMHDMKLNFRHKCDRDLYFDMIHNYAKYSKMWL